MLSYEQTLRLFSVWLAETAGITRIEDVKDIHIRSYINDLQARGKYTYCSVKGSEKVNRPQNRRDYQEKISNITINNYLRNLRAFFAWLVDVEYLVKSPMAKIQLLPDERRAKEFLDDAEVLRLLKSLDKSYYPEYRDYVLILLMLDSGTRLGESLSAEVTQFNLNDKSLHLPADKTKGRKARTVFFSTKTAREIRHWLQYKDRYCESEYIFIQLFASLIKLHPSPMELLTTPIQLLLGSRYNRTCCPFFCAGESQIPSFVNRRGQKACPFFAQVGLLSCSHKVEGST